MQTGRARVVVKFLLALAIMSTAALWMTSSFVTCPSQMTSQADDNFYREWPSSVDVEVRRPSLVPPTVEPPTSSPNEIECIINDEYSVPCRQYSSEVFLPFSFISRYFEVYGKVTKPPGGTTERFEWHHSYSRVYHPRGKYSHTGIFMSFEHYNVEYRDRVKCITGREEVPLSTQWGPQGYFYPIQIAQYGLSHYSKYLVDSTRNSSVLEDAQSGEVTRWSTSAGARVKNVLDVQTGSRVIAFHSEDLGAVLKVRDADKTPYFFLSFDLKVTDNASVVVSIETKTRQVFRLHYVCSPSLISVPNEADVFYGIGERSDWSRVTRDLATDLHKGLALLRGRKKARRLRLLRVISIALVGGGFVDNVTLASNEHLSQFYAAADWLVREQDYRGGWPIPVERVLADGQLQLNPGWYSAMAQGQAISLLVRAYNRTLKPRYLEAALSATALYDVPSAQGGVLAMFADQYSWYEEYPTTPACFVLNGFMYALIALYDLKQTVTDRRGSAAVRLYESGMRSLKVLLPLYDTGSGSIYDLRHFTLGVAPNLARWDYHTTHINQLLLLSTIDADPILRDTASRWTTYMQGHRAPHN